MSVLLELITALTIVTTLGTVEGSTAAATLAMHWPPMDTHATVSSCIMVLLRMK